MLICILRFENLETQKIIDHIQNHQYKILKAKTLACYYFICFA